MHRDRSAATAATYVPIMTAKVCRQRGAAWDGGQWRYGVGRPAVHRDAARPIPYRNRAVSTREHHSGLPCDTRSPITVFATIGAAAVLGLLSGGKSEVASLPYRDQTSPVIKRNSYRTAK